jgi:hypothetical protein
VALDDLIARVDQDRLDEAVPLDARLDLRGLDFVAAADLESRHPHRRDVHHLRAQLGRKIVTPLELSLSDLDESGLVFAPRARPRKRSPP